MRVPILSLVAFLFLMTSSSAYGGEKFDFMVDNKPLNEAELKKAFKGVTHYGFYRFNRDNIPTHKFTETTYADGRVEHVQGEEVLKGRWSIKKNRMCYRYYDIWEQEMCFDMYRVGTCYYHVIRTSGGNRTLDWTARSTPKHQEPDCDPAVA